MIKYSLLVIIITTSYFVSGQNCFDAYDNLFENGGDTLSYIDFHKRELAFLEQLNGCYAPDFSVSSLDGTDLLLTSLKGKVVVLNFWFTSCLPCLKEIPHLNKLTEDFDRDEVVFIALARDNVNDLYSFFKRFGAFTYHIIPESHEIATEYKVIAWPQSMIIDKNGKVYQSWAGAHEKPELLVKEIKQSINNCILEN